MTTQPVTARQLHSILAELKTTDQVVAAVQKLETAKAAIFAGKAKLTAALAELPEVIAVTIPAELHTQAKQLDAWFAAAIAQLRAVPTVVVSVAYLPTHQQVLELVQLVREGVTSPVLVDVRTNESLLAGIEVLAGTQRITVSLQTELNTLVTEVSESKDE